VSCPLRFSSPECLPDLLHPVPRENVILELFRLMAFNAKPKFEQVCADPLLARSQIFIYIGCSVSNIFTCFDVHNKQLVQINLLLTALEVIYFSVEVVLFAADPVYLAYVMPSLLVVITSLSSIHDAAPPQREKRD
jgi:hypothetical protein